MVGAKVASYGYVQSRHFIRFHQVVQISLFQWLCSGGVYNDVTCDTTGVNHGVVVVGWGTFSGVDYWIVRNSWGSGWGSAGYILIQSGINKCGIEKYPSYVIAP